jgi:hypothetical protein
MLLLVAFGRVEEITELGGKGAGAAPFIAGGTTGASGWRREGNYTKSAGNSSMEINGG